LSNTSFDIDSKSYVYPNPLKNNSLLFLADSNSKFKIDIFDLRGRILKSTLLASGEREFKLNFEGFKKGTYLISVTNLVKNQNQIIKVINSLLSGYKSNKFN
jgi:hypothetical protein